MISTPTMAGSRGVGLKSLSPSAVAPMSTILPASCAGSNWIEQLPGGDEAIRPGPRIVEMHIAICIDGYDELADLDVVETGPLAEPRFAVGIGGLDHVVPAPWATRSDLGDQARPICPWK